jgi:hypothetical protein
MLIPALFAAMAIRALIPDGYMPGNVLAGEFMVMCPTSSAATLAGIHHHNHQKHPVDVNQHCPIGSALTNIAPPSSNLPALDSHPAVNAYFPARTQPTVRVSSHAFRSRAPPRTSMH